MNNNILSYGSHDQTDTYVDSNFQDGFRKFHGRHSDLVGKYNISVSHMLQGLLDNTI